MSINRFERVHAEGFYAEKDIEELHLLQAGECYFCGKKLGYVSEKGAFHIDHLIPISNDGTSWPANLALTCEHCNKRKHDGSTSRLWAKLRAEKGADWVKGKILKNRGNAAKKARLTQLRKAERSKSLDQLSKELEVAIRRCAKKLGYTCPENIDISVTHSAYYVDIWCNNSCITMPAPTQKKLNIWHVDEFDTLASALLEIEFLAGYVQMP